MYAYFFSDILHFDMRLHFDNLSLLILTVTMGGGGSNKHCLLSLFSFEV